MLIDPTEEDEVEVTVNAKLSINAGDLMLDGVFTDAESRGDLFMGLAGNEGAHDTHLFGRQTQLGNVSLRCAG